MPRRDPTPTLASLVRTGISQPRKANMITSKTRTAIALIGAALLLSANCAEARSSKPNPEALARVAAKAAIASKNVNLEVAAFLDRLAKDKDYAKRFDQAVLEKSVDNVSALIKQGGLDKSKITIESGITSSFRLRIRACQGPICVTITINW